jgi:hypothetical protein
VINDLLYVCPVCGFACTARELPPADMDGACCPIKGHPGTKLVAQRRPPITLRQRALNYNGTYPDRPRLVVWEHPKTKKEWLYGVWEIGNDYKNKAGYYGEYPPGFLDRLKTLFYEVPSPRVLHCFAGTVPPGNPFGGVRVDIRQDMLTPTLRGDARTLPFLEASFDLELYDPPYSSADAENYGTGLPVSRLVTQEAARVCRAGGHLAWLDTSKPMYQKRLWELIGEIGVARSTMHRVRMLFIFRRTQELVY